MQFFKNKMNECRAALQNDWASILPEPARIYRSHTTLKSSDIACPFHASERHLTVSWYTAKQLMPVLVLFSNTTPPNALPATPAYLLPPHFLDSSRQIILKEQNRMPHTHSRPSWGSSFCHTISTSFTAPHNASQTPSPDILSDSYCWW